MARRFYMSLPGTGRWDITIKQVGAQLRPYEEFLLTAERAAKQRKLVLGWRRATEGEVEAFEERLDERYRWQKHRAKRSKKRRDRRLKQRPTGVWIVLEPPPWQPEEPDETFEAFYEEKYVYQAFLCHWGDRVERLEFDREGQAILVPDYPEAVEPPETEEEPPPPSRAVPYGQLLWLKPNTYTLERQRFALRDLINEPSPRVAPLLWLAAVRPRWQGVAPVHVEEEEWVFLKSMDGVLRDGTDEQRRFVSIARGTPDFALLEGPPGSGKTTAICELIAQLAQEGKRVLLVASTHVAVDNVLERLIEWQDQPDQDKLILPVRIGDEDRITNDKIVPFTLQRLKKTWRDDLRDFFDEPGEVDPAGDAARAMLREAINAKGSEHDSPLMRLLLDSSNLVCGTTIGILQHPVIKAAKRGKVPVEPFDVMILDEASKTTFTEFLVPAMLARRWIIVGDIKQLSPYVEEIDLAENIRRLVPEQQGNAAVHAFLASPHGGRRVRSLMATSDEDSPLVRAEVEARDVAHVDLDTVTPTTLRGVHGAVPELLFADLVTGSPGSLRRFEHRLPADLVGECGPTPSLSDWRAARRAWVDAQKKRVDIDEEFGWAEEVSWRLVRSYELRQNDEERDRYQRDVASLMPVTLDDEWFRWRKTKPKRSKHADQPETATEALHRELDTIRRVTMPSILELLQRGFEQLGDWTDETVLTDGLTGRVLEQRLVSLRFQHRMHPDISAFSREQFYTPGVVTRLDDAESGGSIDDEEYPQDTNGDSDSWYGEDEDGQVLLLDASTMLEDRDWDYPRYARRALWLDVDSRGRRGGRKNSSPAEATVMMRELDAFVRWALSNPKVDRTGQTVPYEVAMLTFYRGQEALLRDRLRQKTGMVGNTRNFRFHPRSDKPAVRVTLCTVDRFQGHEADLVLLSFVKAGPAVGFLNSPNRLNVALTRACFQIVLVGHRSRLGSKECRSPLIRTLANSPHYSGDIGWEDES